MQTIKYQIRNRLKSVRKPTRVPYGMSLIIEITYEIKYYLNHRISSKNIKQESNKL